MAINRKGMRKIVVSDKVYYYKISGKYSGEYYAKIVIEFPDNTIRTHCHSLYHSAITPKYIRTLIEGELYGQSKTS
jgi:hypothetical protein